jgi:hypothetical protein
MSIFYKALFNDGDSMIYARKNRILRFLDCGTVEVIFSIPVSWITSLLMCSRLLTRIFRLGVYRAALHGHVYVVCCGGKLYSYDKITKKLEIELVFEKGRGPLSFCDASNVVGFGDTLYFGDYFSDANLDRIRIRKRLSSGEWKTCYTFQEGRINHIHSLVPDAANNCIWILTGDFGSAAAIYRSSDDFNNIELIVHGEQMYRACVAYPVPDGLLYATDSQFERNSIRILKQQGGVWVSEHLFDVNGPVIYGCELADYYVFSTSVEPGEVKSNFICTLLDRTKGAGILRNQVEIVGVEKVSMALIGVETNPKDFWPANLFQIGSAMFAGPSPHNNQLFIYYTGTKNNEGQTKVIELSDDFTSWNLPKKSNAI